VQLPRFSIAAKLYAIFALLATVTVALAAVAVKSVADDLGSVAARVRIQLDAFFHKLRGA
jgi:hypothetical protein